MDRTRGERYTIRLGPLPRGLGMTALISLLQRIRQTVHQASMARLARSMPEANPLTLEITANILASHGLLDEQSPFKPTVGDTRQFVWLTRAAMGWRR
jgi:hypothetical protein